MEWFLRLAGGEPINPSHYIKVGNSTANCPGFNKICTILANDDGFGTPVLDTAILTQMVLALNAKADRPRVRLRHNY